MKLYIKNMVCDRCKMAVRAVLEKAGLHAITVDLGEVVILEDLPKTDRVVLNTALKNIGFEIIDDRKGTIIEKIKIALIGLTHYGAEQNGISVSQYISGKLHYDYAYLSNLFSGVEGTTIEKYFISLKIERVKEMLVYDELSLSEIAWHLGYSSVSHLSAQFKKLTGLTPSYYKSLKEHKRKNIDDL